MIGTKVKVSVDEKGVLDKATRMFNGSLATVVRELLQNARRAGAKNARVLLQDTWLHVLHDGASFSEEDLASLVTFGSSGWDEHTQGEDPAGMGFFSTGIFPETRITWHTDDSDCEVVFTGKTLTVAGYEVEVLDAERALPRGYTVRFSMDVANVCTESFSRYDWDRVKWACLESLLRVEAEIDHNNTSDEECLDAYAEIAEWCVYKKDTPEYTFYFINMVAPGLVNGISVRNFDSYNTTLSGRVLAYGSKVRVAASSAQVRLMRKDASLVVVAKPESGLRLTLPDRTAIIEGAAEEHLKQEILQAWADYITDEQVAHTMTYKAYYLLRKFREDFPPARAEDVLPSSAFEEPDGGRVFVCSGTAYSGADGDMLYALLHSVKEIDEIEYVPEVSFCRGYQGYDWADAFYARDDVIADLSEDTVEFWIGGKPIDLEDPPFADSCVVDTPIEMYVNGVLYGSVPALVFPAYTYCSLTPYAGADEFLVVVYKDASHAGIDNFVDNVCEMGLAETDDYCNAIAYADTATRIQSAIYSVRFNGGEALYVAVDREMNKLGCTLPWDIRSITLKTSEGLYIPYVRQGYTFVRETEESKGDE